MEELKSYYKLFQPIWEGYEQGKLLGSGSFGDVYELKRRGVSEIPTEAFKEIVVPPASAGGMREALFQGLDVQGAKFYYEGMRKKALEEVEILKKLSYCPNIVKIIDYKVYELPEEKEEFGWVIFVRMEMLEPFKNKILRDGICLYEMVELIKDLCTALEVCHAEGILHRDIKPENIFYSPVSKNYKLGDFGIACYMSRVTEEKGLPGTLTHMTPEVYCGGQFDYAADLYAVGMILYKMLNENRVPFLPDYPEKYSPVMRNRAIQCRLGGEEISLPSIVRKGNRKLCPFLKIQNETDEAIKTLAEIAMKAIAADYQRRYRTPKELKSTLEKWEELYK